MPASFTDVFPMSFLKKEKLFITSLKKADAADRGLRIRAKFFEHKPRPHGQKAQKTGIFCGLTVQTAETASKKHP